MNLVLDASVVLAWCFEDDTSDYASRVLDSLRESEAVVPGLWALEVANGLVTAERRGRIDASDSARFVDLVLSLPIAIDPVSPWFICPTRKDWIPAGPGCWLLWSRSIIPSG